MMTRILARAVLAALAFSVAACASAPPPPPPMAPPARHVDAKTSLENHM